MKECVICNAEFKPKTSEVTCSKVCQKENAKRRLAIRMQDPLKYKAMLATKKRFKDKTKHLRNKYDDVNKQDRQCIMCQKEYVGHIQSTTCSKECRRVHRNNRKRELEPPKVEVFKDCEYCNEPFKARYKRSKYCSTKCQQTHYGSMMPKKLNGVKYIVKSCEWCNSPFESYLGHAKYCSKTCISKMNKVRHSRLREQWKVDNPIRDKDCLKCGKTFTPYSRAGDIKYCSNKCLKRHWSEMNPKPTIEKEKRPCTVCSTSFLPAVNNQKTCSKVCGSEMRIQNRKAKTRQIIPCEICSKEFHKIGNKYTCSKACQNIKRRIRMREYFKNNSKQRLSQRISRGVRMSLKGIKKHKPTFKIIGYTRENLILHLESQFTEENGYSWDNMDEWHIDHIRPVASFNFDSAEHPDFKKCWALNNLQPLWARDNMSKGDKWDGKVNA